MIGNWYPLVICTLVFYRHLSVHRRRSEAVLRRAPGGLGDDTGAAWGWASACSLLASAALQCLIFTGVEWASIEFAGRGYARASSTSVSTLLFIVVVVVAAIYLLAERRLSSPGRLRSRDRWAVIFIAAAAIWVITVLQETFAQELKWFTQALYGAVWPCAILTLIPTSPIYGFFASRLGMPRRPRARWISAARTVAVTCFAAALFATPHSIPVADRFVITLLAAAMSILIQTNESAVAMNVRSDRSAQLRRPLFPGWSWKRREINAGTIAPAPATEESKTKPCASRRRALAISFSAMFLVVATAMIAVDPAVFFGDDCQSQYFPVFAEISRAVRGGEWPTLSVLSWHSGALGGEYQYGIFNPLTILLAVSFFPSTLSLETVAMCYFLITGGILITGAYFLAEDFSLPPPLAATVAISSHCSGMLMMWGSNWYPMLLSFAFIPWFWLTMRMIVAGRRPLIDIPLGALAAAMVVTAGWPFSDCMLLVIAATVGCTAALRRRAFAPLLHVGVALALGVLLAAPSLLMWQQFASWSGRIQYAKPEFNWKCTVPLRAWYGLFLPSLNVPWDMLAHWTLRLTRTLHCGLAPVALLLVGATRIPRRLLLDRDAVVIFAATALLAALPSISPLRYSFRWLPLFHVALAICACRAWSQLDSLAPPHGSKQPLLAPAVALVIIALAFIVQPIDLAASNEVAAYIASLALAGGWLLCEWKPAVLGRARIWFPFVVVVLSTCILIATQNLADPPTWRFKEPLPTPAVLEEGRTYLAIYDDRDLGFEPPKLCGGYGPGNAPMLSNLRFVNGFTAVDPMGTTHLFDLRHHGFIYSRDRLLSTRTSPGPLLKRMAVDGLVLTRRRVPDDLPLGEFELVFEDEIISVYHRIGPKTALAQTHADAWICSDWTEARKLMSREEVAAGPVLENSTPISAPIRSEFARADLRVVEHSRLRTVAAVEKSNSDLPVLVTFARAWIPGYRASLDGKEIEVRRIDGMMPAVVLRTGEAGEVTLEYDPPALQTGLGISGIAAVISLLSIGAYFLRRRTAEAMSPPPDQRSDLAGEPTSRSPGSRPSLCRG